LEPTAWLRVQSKHEFRKVGVKDLAVPLDHPLIRFVVELSLYSSRLLFDALSAFFLIFIYNFAQFGSTWGNFSKSMHIPLNHASLVLRGILIFFVLGVNE
jgi:hypothetical protein